MSIESGQFAHIQKREGGFEIVSKESEGVIKEYSGFQHPMLTPDAIWHIVSHFKSSGLKSVCQI
jgi:hypothetical protein